MDAKPQTTEPTPGDGSPLEWGMPVTQITIPDDWLACPRCRGMGDTRAPQFGAQHYECRTCRGVGALSPADWEAATHD